MMLSNLNHSSFGLKMATSSHPRAYAPSRRQEEALRRLWIGQNVWFLINRHIHRNPTGRTLGKNFGWRLLTRITGIAKNLSPTHQKWKNSKLHKGHHSKNRLVIPRLRCRLVEMYLSLSVIVVVRSTLKMYCMRRLSRIILRLPKYMRRKKFDNRNHNNLKCFRNIHLKNSNFQTHCLHKLRLWANLVRKDCLGKRAGQKRRIQSQIDRIRMRNSQMCFHSSQMYCSRSP